jgi:hypothetical protein
MKISDWILLLLISFASALVTVVIFNLISLSKYQDCMQLPLTELPKYCEEFINGQ